MDLPGHKLSVAEHVKFTVIDGEAIVIDSRGGKYLGLNEVATRVLQLLSESGTVHQVIASLLKEYDVAEDILRRDVTILLDELVDRGLVIVK
jgi:hypothetical protein